MSVAMRCHFTSTHFHLLRVLAGQTERSALMRRSSYGERDYAFGELILTLRSAIGLTQAGLSDHLGISKKAVGEWEAGSSYPKATHLKALIALAVKEQVFPVGHEEEEIRALWKAAHRKVLLDETWLSVLLSEPPAPSAQVSVEQNVVPKWAALPLLLRPAWHWSHRQDSVHPRLGRSQAEPLLPVDHSWIGGTRWMYRASLGARGNWPRSPSGPGRHRQVRSGGACHARLGLPLRRGALSLPARRPAS